jgi:hypothetical protein
MCPIFFSPVSMEGMYVDESHFEIEGEWDVDVKKA